MENQNKPKVFQDIYYHHPTHLKGDRRVVYPGKIIEIDLNGTVSLIYFGMKLNSFTDGATRVSYGTKPGQWWHSLEELQAAIDLDYDLARTPK